jgi:hypothetical protein
MNTAKSNWEKLKPHFRFYDTASGGSLPFIYNVRSDDRNPERKFIGIDK